MQIDFSNAKILVVGDVMLDHYVNGIVNRISPEAPVPIFKKKEEHSRLGGAANAAQCVAMLGAEVCLIGLVGDDEGADQINELLAEIEGLRNFLVRVPGKNTITKTRIMSLNQQLIRIDHEPVLSISVSDIIFRAVQNCIDDVNLVILSDYQKGALVGCQQIIRLANSRNIKILVDPKGDDWEKYRNASIIKPNLKEFEAVAGETSDDDQLTDSALRIIDQYGLKGLLVTRSEYGMTHVTNDKRVTHTPTISQDVFDVTGAGDCVIATYACCLASGIGDIDAAHLATCSASICVSKLGTYAPTLEELMAEYLGSHKTPTFDLPEPNTDYIFQAYKSQKFKIVMTNGCFDLLHPGHLRYLKAARRLGDCLVVGINSDVSVSKLKGCNRPINSENVRKEILESLSFVDHVVIFKEETPGALYEKYTPDILVKGSDYDISDVVGADHVIANGGEVILLDFVAGYSSSNIISKIKGVI